MHPMRAKNFLTVIRKNWNADRCGMGTSQCSYLYLRVIEAAILFRN